MTTAKKRSPLFTDDSLTGSAYTTAHADAAAAWFGELFETVVNDSQGVALVAVGGFGRGELWPHSDLDVVLLRSRKRSDVSELAEGLWYPVWDRGLKLGYGVFQVSEAIKLAEAELDQATSLLNTRLLGGDPSLLADLDAAVDKLWAKRSDELLARLSESVDRRHARVGDVAFTIEPDLKEGRGGLRDLHALAWAERADPDFGVGLLDDLAPQRELLSAARVALHRSTGRHGDVLSLDDQDDVAALMGGAESGNGQDLMLRLALGARRIGWSSDEAWARWDRARTRPRRGRPRVDLSPELELIDDLVELKADIEPDGLSLLRVAETAARTGATIGRSTLERLQESSARIPEPWPKEARDLLAALLLAGRPMIHVVEDLDQYELMVRILPEWAAVRCKPQRNVMHTFTVDRHLCEAAANAAGLTEGIERPDLLVIGALLHDIGKGYPGDHTEVGMELIETIGTRMGFSVVEVAVLVDLCRHHLLLPDVATRRDISDPGTISAIAAAVDSVGFLALLKSLTEADSMATGPSAWGSWKASLISDLAARTTAVLQGAPLDDVIVEFPTAEISERMAAGERWISGSKNTLTVVAPDQPGLFGKIAGVVAMTGLEVLRASAHSEDGMAANQVTVLDSSTGPIDWDAVAGLVERALDGRLALSARVARRRDVYGRHQRRLSAEPPRRLVNVDNSISDVATVVDVHAPDTIGLLFRITRALQELRLDIRSAKVQTLGPQAVDSFYLTDTAGQKVTDVDLVAELRLALTETITE